MILSDVQLYQNCFENCWFSSGMLKQVNYDFNGRQMDSLVKKFLSGLFWELLIFLKNSETGQFFILMEHTFMVPFWKPPVGRLFIFKNDWVNFWNTYWSRMKGTSRLKQWSGTQYTNPMNPSTFPRYIHH